MTEKEKVYFYGYIGEKIKQLRLSMNMTQEELAKKLKKSRVTVVNIEKGRQHPPLHMIIDFARVFKVPAGDFINEKRWNRNNKTERELIENELKNSLKTKKGQNKLLDWMDKI